MPPQPAAPVAPAAPAPPSPSAPSAPAAPTPSPASGGGAAGGGAPTIEKSAFDKFDEAIPEFTPPPAKPAAPAGGAPKKPDAPATPPPPSPAPKPGDIPDFKTNKELREWALNQHKSARELGESKAALEAKIADLEKRVPKSAEDAANLTSTINQLNKKLEDYESRIRLLDYERSEEYKTKYADPYQKALKSAYRDVGELLVSEDTGELDANEQPVVKRRQATKEDFKEILSLPLGPATDLAEKKFGRAAYIVLQHRLSIRQLSEDAYSAIEEYRGKAGEMEKARMEQETHRRTSEASLWNKANEILTADEKHKDDWGKSEDPEVQKALDAGFQFADKVFSDAREKMPLQDRVMMDALARHRIAGYSRLRYENQKLRHELAAKNEEITQLRAGAPGDLPGGGGGGDTPTESEGAMAEFDKRLK